MALSSGESELYVTLKSAAEALGMLSIIKDLGWTNKCEIWGDVSAALGIMQCRGFGKTRHIDTGLLWVHQVAAQKRLSFNKVLCKNNPADLVAQHLDEATILRHTNAMVHKFAIGRAAEAPKLHLLQTLEYEVCEDVRIVSSALNSNKSLSSVGRNKMMKGVGGALEGEECDGLGDVTRPTGSGQQVRQGYTWRVQGSNGSNAAQLSHAWGSTLTFQRNVGVSWVLWLRHGVAMHPMGGDI